MSPRLPFALAASVVTLGLAACAAPTTADGAADGASASTGTAPAIPTRVLECGYKAQRVSLRPIVEKGELVAIEGTSGEFDRRACEPGPSVGIESTFTGRVRGIRQATPTKILIALEGKASLTKTTTVTEDGDAPCEELRRDVTTEKSEPSLTEIEIDVTEPELVGIRVGDVIDTTCSDPEDAKLLFDALALR